MAIHGVLGDIHGNREALEACLARLEALGIARVVCVGDLVGYNADHDACVAMLRERDAAAIAGNHDLIATGRLGFERCSNKAMHSLKRTRGRLGPEAAAYIAALPSHHRLAPDVLLTHGGVRDVQQYMTRPQHILENARMLAEDFPGTRICFYGHTHEQKVWEVRGDELRDVTADAVTFDPGCVYFVNPGSVDASRKRTHKLAELAIFDEAARTLRFERVPYDEAATESKAWRGGFRIERWRDRLYDYQRRIVGPRQIESA